jgi:hypothetical protein
MDNDAKALLRYLLRGAIRSTFTQLVELHPTEKFYAFGLYIDDLASYVLPTANSEEALLRRSNGYAKTPIRWNPPDWEYHLSGEEFFSQVEEFLSENCDPYAEDLTDDEQEETTNAVIGECERCLRELDTEDFFNRKSVRESLLISVFMVAQGDERALKHAQQLNSRELTERYRYELKYCREWPPEETLATDHRLQVD